MLSLEVRVLVRGFRWQFGQWGWAVEFEVVVVDVGFGLEGQATTAVTTSLRLTAPPSPAPRGEAQTILPSHISQCSRGAAAAAAES